MTKTWCMNLSPMMDLVVLSQLVQMLIKTTRTIFFEVSVQLELKESVTICFDNQLLSATKIRDLLILIH